ncbi:MAG: serine hydrolase domain-containing protein, partial [Lysobacterales bacterium]
MKRAGIFSAMIVLLACLVPFPALSAQTKIEAEKLDRYFDALVSQDRIMLSIELAREGAVLYRYQGGFASVEDQRPLTEKSRFRIGSITKTFTAVLVLQLVEEGLIGLDTSLEQYVPAVKNASGITLKHLLSHRSGIANFTNAPEYANYMTKAQTRQQLIERIAALEPEFEPGDRYGYSNSNYFLLGAIVEDVSGKDY